MEEAEIMPRVVKYLDAGRRKEYRNVLNKIKDSFIAFQRTKLGSEAIYRITSRGDYQDKEEIKRDREVAEKIRRKSKDLPGFNERHINDYIGVRIVCVYPSDFVSVIEHIGANFTLHDVEWQVPKDEPGSFVDPTIKKLLHAKGFSDEIKVKGNPRGYRALHLVVSLRTNPLKCEIQILTILQETWAYKTHDTVYKNRTEPILDEHRKHTTYLSRALWA